MAKTVLKPQRRKELLAEAYELYQKLDDLEVAYETVDDDEEATAHAQAIDAALARLDHICEEYLDGLPAVGISRCPICEKRLAYPIDTFGLGGLWWNVAQPVRPEPEEMDPHFFALTGAVVLGQGVEGGRASVEVAPILVEPGPERPFVIPRLFDVPDMQAVLSTLRIGEQTAYAIVYFADPVPKDALRANTWGSDRYEYLTADGDLKWAQAFDVEQEYEFDLRECIEGGQLKWIVPGDENLTLREGLEECPYLELEGRHEVLCLQHGRVWSIADVDSPEAKPEPGEQGEAGQDGE